MEAKRGPGACIGAGSGGLVSFHVFRLRLEADLLFNFHISELFGVENLSAVLALDEFHIILA